MATFTTAELDAQIAAYKAALTALATSAEYALDVGGSRTTVRKADLLEIRKTIEWLDSERQKLDTTSDTAASIVGAAFFCLNHNIL
jgi:hypothetical protein